MSTVRLNHVITGPDDAPVVLLGSALGASHAMWEPQVEALSKRFRVVAFDHRGHGGSDVPTGPYTMDALGNDVVHLLDGLGVEQASYAGISLGGMVGLWLAENAPQRLHRLVVLCAAATPPGGGWRMWSDRARQVRADGTAAIADATIGRWFPPSYPDTDLVARTRQLVLDTPDEGYAGCCEAIGGMKLRAGLGGIGVPTLVVAADGDQSVPAETVLATAGAIPGARFEVVEDAAHLVSASHPERVNALLLGHLA